MRQSEYAIQVQNLWKSYGAKEVLRGVDLLAKRGQVYALLGPNGAGKTTFIRTLATLIKPDSGSVKVFGYDVLKEGAQVRRKISLTGQFAAVDEELSGQRNLILFGRLLGFSRRAANLRAAELLAAFDLKEAAEQPVKQYSGGMRRRLDIAASIIATPELLFLDEPTTGLDPRSRNQIWELVRKLVAAGTTVFLTTQYLEEADELADYIVIIDQGKVIAEGAPGQLKASLGTGALHIRCADPAQRGQAERILARLLSTTVFMESDLSVISVQIPDSPKAVAALEELMSSGIRVSQFSLGQPSLDEVFLTLTGHPARNEKQKGGEI
ncbi:MAG TPA: ATP-binding cassette domain-containing protein [Bacillota bacterium]|nr:ATP-binding cassette domain-containing protein [Bacillota bacterium]